MKKIVDNMANKIGNCETNNQKRCIDHESRMYYKNLQFHTNCFKFRRTLISQIKNWRLSW